MDSPQPPTESALAATLGAMNTARGKRLASLIRFQILWMTMTLVVAAIESNPVPLINDNRGARLATLVLATVLGLAWWFQGRCRITWRRFVCDLDVVAVGLFSAYAVGRGLAVWVTDGRLTPLLVWVFVATTIGTLFAITNPR